MAELYLARTVGPEGFEKLVVLKKILRQHADNPTFVRLFIDEAKLGASLHHPNIAAVHDIGTVDGNYFFAMEFVHGQDVRAILRRSIRLGELLPLEHAVEVARDIAAALNHAHERRGPDGVILDIVHRDVSPSNIVVSYDGAVKLLDFGVAKTTTRSIKTETGLLKGKVSYMSPEQARGATIDRRSDVFSLGIVLWELITSRRLYKGENDLATIHRITNDPTPPPTAFRHDCPTELERIVGRALASDPARRYQNAEDLQSELEEFAREHKLAMSSIALSRHICRLFANEVRAWRDAENTGVTLSAHVAERSTDATTEILEGWLCDVDSDFDSGESELAPPPRKTATTATTPVRDPAVTDETVTLKSHVPAHGIGEAPTVPAPVVVPSSVATLLVAPARWKPRPHGASAARLRRRVALGAIAAFGVATAIAVTIGHGASSLVSAPPSTAPPPHPVGGPVAAKLAPEPTNPPTPAPDPSPTVQVPARKDVAPADRDSARIVQRKASAPKRSVTTTKVKPPPAAPSPPANVVPPVGTEPRARQDKPYDPNDPFPPQ